MATAALTGSAQAAFPRGTLFPMWKTRRRAVALLTGAGILLLPFLRFRGESVLRFDILSLQLHVLGTVLWIDEFHMVLLGVLFLLVLTLGLTVAFGRVWCGWLCPQTVIGELAEWAASLLPERFRTAGRMALLVPLSGLVSLSLLWYFVPPAVVWRDLPGSPVLVGFFLAQWAVIYGMAGVLGTRFCGTVCPYAMLQNAVADRDTIAVAFDSARGDCLRCDSCTRACPVGIDIRKGDRRECIACATCIDACRRATSPRGVDPFLEYRGRILRAKTYLFAAASAAAGLVFLSVLWSRPAVAFMVQWDARPAAPAENVYRYSARNHTRTPVTLTLSVDKGVRILGGARIAVPPRSRITGTFTAAAAGTPPEEIRITASGGGFRFVRKAAFP